MISPNSSFLARSSALAAANANLQQLHVGDDLNVKERQMLPKAWLSLSFFAGAAEEEEEDDERLLENENWSS